MSWQCAKRCKSKRSCRSSASGATQMRLRHKARARHKANAGDTHVPPPSVARIHRADAMSNKDRNPSGATGTSRKHPVPDAKSHDCANSGQRATTKFHNSGSDGYQTSWANCGRMRPSAVTCSAHVSRHASGDSPPGYDESTLSGGFLPVPRTGNLAKVGARSAPRWP